MNRTEHQRFPDGTRVRFTDKARESMRGRPGVTKPLRTPGDGTDAVYTIDNTDDNLHDVILRETGERYGTYWLEPVDVEDSDLSRPEHSFPAYIVGSRGPLKILSQPGTGRTGDPRENGICIRPNGSLDPFADVDRAIRDLSGTTQLLELRRLGWAETHPPIVTICGSTRFHEEIREANRELTLAGCMVLAPGVFAHDGDEISEAQKVALDALHLRKIDLADQVLVVDPESYVGASTTREIGYARAHSKPVTFTSGLVHDDIRHA